MSRLSFRPGGPAGLSSKPGSNTPRPARTEGQDMSTPRVPSHGRRQALKVLLAGGAWELRDVAAA